MATAADEREEAAGRLRVALESARTEPRFTRDIDVVIAVRDDRDAERAVHALQQRG